jgi:hypothetical protein
VSLWNGGDASSHLQEFLRTVDPLVEARAALESGNFTGCAAGASAALRGGDPQAVLEASWLHAQCSLLQRDPGSARGSLRHFWDNAPGGDPRLEVVRAQRRAIARGQLPDGVRVLPRNNKEAAEFAERVAPGEAEATRLVVTPSGISSVVGELNPTIVDRIVAEKVDELSACVVAELPAASERDGLAMTWIVNATGDVVKAWAKGGLAGDTMSCLTSRVESWVFPRGSSERGMITVTLHFVFERRLTAPRPTPQPTGRRAR